ncbi:MAG: RDD family protein [Tepidisphaerales bacterium]
MGYPYVVDPVAKKLDRQFGKPDGATIERVEQLDEHLYPTRNGRRILSAAIDVFLLAMLFGAEVIVVPIVMLLTMGEGRDDEVSAWVWVGACNAVIVVCILAEAANGVTIGKKITGCVARLNDGAPAGRGRLCARSSIKYLPLIAHWVLVVPTQFLSKVQLYDFHNWHPYGPYILIGLYVLTGATFAGWCICLIAPTHRALHDRLTRTAVFRSAPLNEPRGFEVWPTNATDEKIASAKVVKETAEG